MDYSISHDSYHTPVFGSGELCTSIFDSLPVGVLVEDMQEHHLFANRTAASMTGYSVEELMQGVWMVHPDDTKAAGILERAISEGIPGSNYETRFVRKDGTEFWVSISWNPLRDKDSNVTGLCTVFADITDKKRTERELSAASERYSMLADHASDMFFEWDVSGVIAYASPSVKQLGYTPDELLGTSIFDLAHPDDRAISHVRRAEHLNSLQPQRYEIRFLAKDQSARWMEAQIDLVLENGKPVRVHAVIRDITERKSAEEAVLASERLYKSIVENSNDLITLRTPDGVLSYASPACREINGYEPDEFARRNPRIVHPDDIELVEELSEAARRGETRTCVEYRIISKTGETKWVSHSFAPIFDGDEVQTVVSVIRDVTPRKMNEHALRRAQDALADSEQKYKSIVENSSDLISLTRPDGLLLYASPAALSITGYTPEELMSLRPWIIHPDDSIWVWNVFDEAMQGSTGSDLEYRITTKSGETRWISHKWVPIFADGEFQSILGVIRDVTERRTSEEALHQAQNALMASEQRYKSIVENSKDLIMLNLPEGPIAYASPAMKDMLGYDPDEFVGAMPNVIHPDDAPAAHAAFGRAARGESGANFEYRISTRSGDTKWVSHTWSPVYLDGQLQSIISVIRDVTENKESQEQLRKAHEELEQAYMLQREFLNNVTHEVRTPLTAVQGYTEMLMDGLAGPVSEEQAALLQKVMNSSEHLLDVLNAVLQTARMKSGRMAIRPKVSDPRLVVEKCISAVLPQASKKGLNINIIPNLDGVVATYDEEKLTIVVTNLLGNAVKFTSSGSIEVIVTALLDGCDIVVADTGVGIAEPALTSIFDEFTQLDYPGKHKPSGFGLGLAIVAAVVDAMGASLTVSSKKGLGTAFTLSVPAMHA